MSVFELGALSHSELKMRCLLATFTILIPPCLWYGLFEAEHLGLSEVLPSVVISLDASPPSDELSSRSAYHSVS